MEKIQSTLLHTHTAADHQFASSVAASDSFSSCSPLKGLMFGYATDETEECMPLTIVLAHKLNAKMAELRRSGVITWLRPDSKTQVRFLYCSYNTNGNKSIEVFL